MKNQKQIIEKIKQNKDELLQTDDRYDCTQKDVIQAKIEILEWVLGGKENAR